jgi:hypothetical protein
MKSAFFGLFAIVSALLPIGAMAQTPVTPPVLTPEAKTRPIITPVVLTTIPVWPVEMNAKSVNAIDIGKMSEGMLVINPDDIKGRRLILPTVEGKGRQVDICIGRRRGNECRGIYIGTRAD